MSTRRDWWGEELCYKKNHASLRVRASRHSGSCLHCVSLRYPRPILGTAASHICARTHSYHKHHTLTYHIRITHQTLTPHTIHSHYITLTSLTPHITPHTHTSHSHITLTSHTLHYTYYTYYTPTLQHTFNTHTNTQNTHSAECATELAGDGARG